MPHTTKTVLVAAVGFLFGCQYARANFIVNGDFSAGNTGFTTEYIYSPGNIGGAQTYAVVHSPGDARPSDHNGASLIDHTTGTGLLLAVNGGVTPNVVVWSETIAVTPTTNYDFSLYLASWFAGSPATLDIQFNNVSVGTPTAPPSVNPWEQFTATWNSASNTSLTIKIIDTNLAGNRSQGGLAGIGGFGYCQGYAWKHLIRYHWTSWPRCRRPSWHCSNGRPSRFAS
jgi:hypothetical protein